NPCRRSSAMHLATTSAWRPENAGLCRSSASAGAGIAISHVTRRRFWRASGVVFAIVDTGPLYAAVDADDADHARCVAELARPEFSIVVPCMVVAETTYLVATRLGAEAETRFLRSLRDVDVEGPAADDWVRIAELAQRYANFPLGGTDASVIALAE